MTHTHTQHIAVVRQWNMNGTMESQNQTKTGNKNNGNNNNYKHFNKFKTNRKKTIKRMTLKIHDFFLQFYVCKHNGRKRNGFSFTYSGFLINRNFWWRLPLSLFLWEPRFDRMVNHRTESREEKTLCSTEKKNWLSLLSIFLVCFFFCVLINLLSFGGNKTNSLETHSIRYHTKYAYATVNVGKYIKKLCTWMI